MKSRWIVGVAVFAALSLSPLPGTTQPCLPLDQGCESEVIVVEPLAATLVSLPQLGDVPLPLTAPVLRPETICGNPSGSAAQLVPCYEFAMTYVSYAADGTQILHLPSANAVPHDDPNCELPSNDLDPSPIIAPVCGEVLVEVIPLNQRALAFFKGAFASWDGVSTNTQIVLTTRTAGAIARNTYTLPTFRIPAAAVDAASEPIAGYTVALVRGAHLSFYAANRLEEGYFSPLKRTVVWNETLGNLHDAISVPVVFANQ